MLRRSLAAFVAWGLWAQAPSHAHASGSPTTGLNAALRDYTALARAAWRLPLDEREAFVNNSINQRIAYRSDAQLHGEVDRWQTPAETFWLAGGDCEDLAIAKYFVLHDCGRPCGCERLLYAIHTPPDTPGLQSAHVVLLGGGHPDDPVVIDNLNPLLLPLSRRSDIRPVLSFDLTSLWRGVSGERVGGAPALLRPWRELLWRWRQQH